MSETNQKIEPKPFNIGALLSEPVNYLIPMYQRNYAWDEREIHQLIRDVVDYQQKGNGQQPYYIGTLVVFKRPDGSYEVIDGQQRFTTLSLIAIYLKHQNIKITSDQDVKEYAKINIDFESRPKSTQTFEALFDKKKLNTLDGDGYNQGIVNGYKLIDKALTKLKSFSDGEKITPSKFADYLFNHVQIIRVEVPPDTDLNHYFEIMNNRGEQLEKHEILKAQMMAVLNTITDVRDKECSLNALNTVWNACSNMERYVQYGFTTDQRTSLFGTDWGKFEVADFDDLVEKLKSTPSQTISTNESQETLAAIIAKPSDTKKKDQIKTEDAPDRFNSVINFSNFLLHVLRVHTQVDIALDDKQLIQQFESHIGKDIHRVKDFIFALLKCKYLFDQYVIKRDFAKGKENWSLKRLKLNDSGSASFVNSFGREDESFKGENRQTLMLLSAFHVSAPTLIYKHWLNAALYFLYQQETVDPKSYHLNLRRTAKRFVFDRFLAFGEGKSYFEMIYLSEENEFPKDIEYANLNTDKLKFGGIENNFVFNYLDYLLWRKEFKGSDCVITEFEFTFRSSVEHFYPQHPMDGFLPLESDVLHEFGNLCLISHSKNSRLSNFPPKAKLAHFAANIKQNSIDSLKLYKIIKLVEERDEWGIDEIKEHGEEMLDVLCRSTKMKTSSN